MNTWWCIQAPSGPRGPGLASYLGAGAKGKWHLSGERAVCRCLVMQNTQIHAKVWLSKATHACQALQDSTGNDSLGTASYSRTTLILIVTLNNTLMYGKHINAECGKMCQSFSFSNSYQSLSCNNSAPTFTAFPPWAPSFTLFLPTPRPYLHLCPPPPLAHVPSPPRTHDIQYASSTSLSSSSIMLITMNQACMAGAVILQLPCHCLRALLWQHNSPASQGGVKQLFCICKSCS